jgi:hypothetical protein
MLFIILRHCWCVIFFKAYGPVGDKSDDSNDTFCEELQQVFDQFPTYHMKILLGASNTKLQMKTFSNQQLKM